MPPHPKGGTKKPGKPYPRCPRGLGRLYALCVWRFLGGWSLVSLGVGLAIGCSNPATFNCQDDAGGGNGGQCEGNGFCSFPDAECESGRRYGDLAGAGLQGQCVAPSEGSTGTPSGTTGDPPGSTGCTPGTSVCACDEGLCDAGLECIANICVPSDDPTFSTSSGTDDTGDATGATVGTGDSDSTGFASTGTTGFESTGVGEATGAPPVCNAEDVTCTACFECVGQSVCDAQLNDCDDIAGCSVIAACLEDCAVTGVCFDDCCEGQPDDARQAALALHTCREDACIGDSCETFAAWLCSG